MFAIAAAALGSAFQHGYNIGVVNAPAEVISIRTSLPIKDVLYLNIFLQLIRTWINDSHYNRTGEPLTSTAVTMIWSWAVSVFCIGGIAGGSLTGILAERLGRFVEYHFYGVIICIINQGLFYRKGALLFNNIFAIIAALLMGFTKMANSYEMLIAGRLFTGINCGLNGGLAPMYLSEISPVHLRGAVRLIIIHSFSGSILNIILNL